MTSDFISIQSYYDNITFSLSLSAVLLINLVFLSRYLSEKKIFFKEITAISEASIFFFIISILSFTTYFISLIGFDLIFLRFCLIGINIFLFFFFIIKFKKKLFRKNLENIDYIFLLFFLILAFAPTSDADSLDYHLGYPLEILRNANFVFRPDWYHSQVSGIGEFYNLFGLISGSPIFGQIINFLSLYYLFIILNEILKNKKINGLKARTLIFSTPLLLWFVYSQKVQLLPSVMLFGSAIYLTNFKEINIKNYLIFLISLSFIFFSKVSFILPTFLIFVYSLKFVYKQKEYYYLIFSIFLILLLPRFYFNYLYFQDIYPPLFERFKSSPDLEYLNFVSDLGTDRATFKFKFIDYIYFPIKFIIPTKLSNLTITLSVYYALIFYFLFNLKNYFKDKFFLFILIITIFLMLLPNFQPRYFLDSYWFLLILILRNYSQIKKNIFFKIINFLGAIQSYLILFALIIFSTYYFSANFSKKRYDLIMSQVAQNYQMILWIHDKIPRNKLVVSDYVRSHALYQNEFISREEYFRKDPFIMNDKYKPDFFILTLENKPFIKKFSRCLLYTGNEKEFYNEARNPFGQKRHKHKIKIYENICK